MPKPRKPKDAARDACGDTLESRVKAQLADAYRLGLEARDQRQRELAELCAHYIFDLLDWGRRHLEPFDDAQRLPAAGRAALTLGDLERLAESRLLGCRAADGPPSASESLVLGMECSDGARRA